MTHPPNSYHYQPATHFDTQEPEHMYQQSHPSHMSQTYEGGQRGLQQPTTGHPRRPGSLTNQAAPHGHPNGGHMMYYYDWKNFPMTQAPGSFIPSPEEANIHGHGHGHSHGHSHGHGPMPTSAMGPMPPFHTFASANPQFMSSASLQSQSQSQQPLTSGSSAPLSTAFNNSNGGSGANSSSSSAAVDPALATPSMNSSSFMPGPSPNFNSSSGMSYSFIPALPPPFGEQYFGNHHRASAMDMRSNSSMGDGPSYSSMYQPPSSHFPNAMHASRLSSPSVPHFSSSMDGDYYSPSLPYHPMMMNHGANMYFQNSSRSASPSVTYSTSPSPSPSHYSHGPSSFACHPFSRPSLPHGSSGMGNGGSGPRLACRPCIRGHRAPSCKHTDRPLFAIRPRGRPSSQCVHCKEARKTGGIHVKCLCGSGSPSSKSSPIPYGSPSPSEEHKIGGMVSADSHLSMDSAYDTELPVQQHHRGSSSSAKAASNKSALAAVMQSFWSGINSSESASHSQESDSASESVSSEANVHRRRLSVEATDTVSQKPPESSQPVDLKVPETQPETTTVHSKCICDLGMPCLCSSKPEKLPNHAEPASITSSLHTQQHRLSADTQQRVLHSNQPMDLNSYEYNRLDAFHEAATEKQQSEQGQNEDDDVPSVQADNS